MAVRELARRQLGNLERRQLVDLGPGLERAAARLKRILRRRGWG
jgi:hypothetical protein